METVRDLAEDELWRESLERSLARRAGSGRRSETRDHPRVERPRAEKRRARRERKAARPSQPKAQPRRTRAVAPPKPRRTRAAVSKHPRPVLKPGRRRAASRRRSNLALGARSVIALAVVAGVILLVLDAQTPSVSSAAAHPEVIRPPAFAKTPLDGPISPGAGLTRHKACPMAIATNGYVNPLINAKVTPERIDQGVDYAGSGLLVAIGTARVTHVATQGTGWPGAFIEYRLLDGADAGCYVYYAEGVAPMPGMRRGDTVLAGQPVAKFIPHYESGIEIGWSAGSGTTSYAVASHRWNAGDDEGNHPSGPGKKFSALIAALGGPHGLVEG